MSTADDDAALVAAFLSARVGGGGGGRSGVDLAMVRRLRPVIERCAVRAFGDMVRSNERAPTVSVADLVQITFAKLFHDPQRTLGRWDHVRAPLEVYVQHIARNTMSNVIRGERRRQRRLSGDAELDEVEDDAERQPGVSLDRRSLGRVVDRFHAEASPLESTLFREVLVEELPAAEVARRHGWKATNTTNLWRFRLLRRLRDIAAQLGGEPHER